MIVRLQGILLDKQQGVLLIDVNGVGYEVFVPTHVGYDALVLDQAVTLFTHFQVREDVQALYGFISQEERQLFRTLIKVNGIGPKLALVMLSYFEPDALVAEIQLENVAALSRIPGIGPKTAKRIAMETKDALKTWAHVSTFKPVQYNSHSDAIEALVALGYKPIEARKAVAALQEQPLNREEMIRAALKKLTG